MRWGGLGRRQVVFGTIGVAVVAALVVFLFGGAVAYPAPLQKYIRVIEATEGGGFSSFRTDVTEQVCPIFLAEDFAALSGKHWDADVKVGPKEISILVTRQMQFMRALIIRRDGDGCSAAFAESYYL